MAWPQQPPPAQPPASPSGSGSNLSLPGLIAAVSGVLTFFFSFVRIFKVEEGGEDVGWSVWTTGFAPGLFGVGTWIPLFALAAGGIALARALVNGIDDKRIVGFSLLQLQLVCLLFSALVWFGYLVSIITTSDQLFEGIGIDYDYGLGILLLFIGLTGLAAGTVMDLLGIAPSLTTAGSPGAPPPQQPGPSPQTGQWQQPPAAASGQWQQAAAPAEQGQWQQAAAPPDQGQWQQPAAPPDQDQWQQPPVPSHQSPWPQPSPEQGQWEPPDPGRWQHAAPDPNQWQPPGAQAMPEPPAGGTEATGPLPPAPAPAPPGPQPEPGPLDPQPAPPQPGPGPGLHDSGTQVIPGPPPAPPTDPPAAPGPPADGGEAPEEPQHPGFPEPPPSNTP